MSITKISQSLVDFDAGITISTTDNSDNLTLTSTDADSSYGPNLNFYRNECYIGPPFDPYKRISTSDFKPIRK